MNIYEKIFARLEEINMSQIELSRRTGIATSTISDWRKKQINPQADKLVAICKALDMSLVDLLCDEEDKSWRAVSICLFYVVFWCYDMPSIQLSRTMDTKARN